MHRTQIQLEERQYRFLKSKARETGKSLSALIRQMVEASIRSERETPDPLLEMIGAAEGPDDDTARKHDTFLYGRKE